MKVKCTAWKKRRRRLPRPLTSPGRDTSDPGAPRPPPLPATIHTIAAQPSPLAPHHTHAHATTIMSSEDLAKDSDVGAKEGVAPHSLEAPPVGRFARFWGKSMTQVALIGMCCFLW